MELLQVSHLKKVYTSKQSKQSTIALQDVNFTIQQHEFVAIMGESGSGKTTLLNLLAGFDQVSGGKIYLEGVPMENMKDQQMAKFRRENIGFVFQDFNLLDQLTIQDNLALPLVLSNVKPKEIAKQVEQVAKYLHLTPLLQKYPYEVSGGQKQRCAVGRSLITHPKLILADEPTGALDSNSSDALMDLFDQINQLGQTILMVTHSIKAASFAKRVMFIKDGQVFHEIYKGEHNQQMFYEKIANTLTMLSTGDQHA